MRKFTKLAVLAVHAASLTACSSGTKETTTESTETESAERESETADGADESEAEASEITTVTPGKLTVATSPDFAPYEFYAIDENGEPKLAGFDISLVQYIADYLNLELEIVPMDFDGTIMELSNKSVDLGVAGYSPSAERAEIIDFSDIYYTDDQAFVCLKENADKFKTLEDTNNADYTISAQTGAIQVDLAKKYSPDANLIEMPKVTDIIAELVSGKIDGAYIEGAVAKSYAVNYPELELVLTVPYDDAGSAVGVVKGNTALLEGVNAAIAECKESGEFDKYVAEANELASGNTYEGLLDENGEAKADEAESEENVSEEAETTAAN